MTSSNPKARLEPLIAFLHSMWSQVSLSCINSICFSLWQCSLLRCFNEVLFYRPSCAPSGNLVLTIDDHSFVSRIISSAKGESNVKAFEWRNLSSAFTSHHHSLKPLWDFMLCCMARSICNERSCLQKPCFRSDTFWYYYRLDDTSTYLAFPWRSSFLNLSSLPLSSWRPSVITSYPSQNTMPKTRFAFPPVLCWAEKQNLLSWRPYYCSRTLGGHLFAWIW